MIRKTSLSNALTFLALCGNAFAQTPNMDAGLSATVRSSKTSQGATARTINQAFSVSYDGLVQKDALGRVLVQIVLDGTVPLPQLRPTLLSLGANIAGENPLYGNGAISAYLPLTSMEALGFIRGVDNLALGYKPALQAGLVTSQGARLMHSDTENINFTGAGITVGVLSDSFDSLNGYSKDVVTKDLPTMKLIKDASGTDEGRAMAQIVYDVAPNASLCFETASGGPAAFAANILDLRTNPACLADVIVDDVSYFTEPFFSDGQIAQMVNTVATSTMLAGKRVAYFSSAGNQQSSVANGNGGGFYTSSATFKAKTTVAGIQLGTIASCPNVSTGGNGTDTGGGFLDFGNNTFSPSVTFSASSFLVMQWDDPFDLSPSGITTDLNYILFDPAGKCAFISGVDNFKTNEAVEVLQANGTGKLMIARTTPGGHRATRVKLVGFGTITTPIFGNTDTPVTFGHSAAAHAISVAAYVYTSPVTQQSVFKPAFEVFSSPGPVTIAFDAAGRRLSVPETRQKPDLAAPDGVNTTFFGTYDYEGDKYPNFFGTSAAAPHAAGVAALMLQKAGGPGSLSPDLLKTYMLTSIPARVIPYSGNSNLAVGWSPFDGFGLLDARIAVTRAPAKTYLTITPTSFSEGNPVTVMYNVVAIFGGAYPTGQVTLTGTCSGGTAYDLQTVAVSPGSPTTITTTLPFLYCQNLPLTFPQSYAVTARYLGDGTYASSVSAPVTVTVSPVMNAQ